ncbi:DUF3540 domain-containing protein [Cedecea sp.]|jgi:hypothetical protein|uniref:DUF3540 domain-containing protein n=1 Tax=Cedecea sp. TaxID=1970739 RepID=UPI0012AE1DEF|nr:DUF3540 domain-containing protein [Enterobacteriaceae bacterium RIT693]
MYDSTNRYSTNATETAIPTTDVRPSQRILVTIESAQDGELVVKAFPRHKIKNAWRCQSRLAEGDRVEAIIDGDILYVTDIIFSASMNQTLMLGGKQYKKIILQAAEIEITGSKHIHCTAPDISLTSRISTLVSDTIHQATKLFFFRARHSYRQTEQSDITRARHIIHDAQQSYSLSSEIGSIKSSAVLKINGNQIHMG